MAKYHTVHRTAPQQRLIHPKLSKVLRLRNFGQIEVSEMYKDTNCPAGQCCEEGQHGGGEVQRRYIDQLGVGLSESLER